MAEPTFSGAIGNVIQYGQRKAREENALETRNCWCSASVIAAKPPIRLSHAVMCLLCSINGVCHGIRQIS